MSDLSAELRQAAADLADPTKDWDAARERVRRALRALDDEAWRRAKAANVARLARCGDCGGAHMTACCRRARATAKEG